MSDKKRSVEFLYEIGMMRYLPRQWIQFLNKNFANQSEHALRVTWIAMILATEEGADVSKVMKMALAHDIAESRSSDVNYISRQYVTRNEDTAIQHMLAGLPFEKEFLDLFQEYKARQTLEAKIVKDADNLDVDFEINEQYANGIKLKEQWQEARDRVYELLFTSTAKEMWKEIQNSNPHDWHVKGNNRFLNGDWKRN